MFKIIIIVFFIAIIGDVIQYDSRNGRYSIILDTNAISIDAFLENNLLRKLQKKISS